MAKHLEELGRERVASIILSSGEEGQEGAEIDGKMVDILKSL